MTQHHLREFMAEFFGTLILVLFATGVVAAGIFLQAWNSFVELALITGAGVTLGIYVAAPNSQAHLNPAITIAMMLWRRFPAKQAVSYIVAQLFGAFSGALLSYFLYRVNVDSSTGVSAIPQFFFTSPAGPINYSQALFVEAILTAILTIIIFAVSDPENKSIPQGPWGALVIGATVALLGSAFGSLTGFAMNPARDFGPRLFAYLAGWGKMAMPGNYYFWVPIFGPIIGAGLGGLLYEKQLRPVSSNSLVEERVLQGNSELEQQV